MKAVRFAKSLTPLLVPIDQVQQHPDNPNNGDDDNLRESIQINGFVTAITADANTGYIVAGNTRYRTLLSLGATQIPVIWEDQWDSMGAKRYLVGDNASSRRAVMDDGHLAQLLNELRATEQGLLGSSVTDAEHDRLLLDLANAAGEVPDVSGFGANQHGTMGMFQIVLDFEDAESERDAVFAELSERYENARVVNL
ncbi:ParB-like partition protein [Arthrobacter phage Tank]|uniref:ParB-like nuclease domain protein n=2 Tax=Tankvirus tank TaxID=1982567 RepID=A0A0U4K230_9CAUD|nr:ParB-like partition protein [Arthrobacter phage Tank]ALY10546.1 ParB-like nuclease domain protein [Arthrobacter phage Tank]ALY10798.1 ParB-like nuclease domain protein [Arthrobacter phage Wilde]